MNSSIYLKGEIYMDELKKYVLIMMLMDVNIPEKNNMKSVKIYKRNIQARLQQALRRSPIVFIKGPRQSGKTTLMKELSGYHFVTLDDFRVLQSALQDPMGFIENLPKPVIIDEVQRAPNLFLAIKYDIDRNRIAGRYVLTGSADPLLMSQVADSLAGRVENLTLYPLSQGELRNIEESFVDRIWSDESLMKLDCEKISSDQLFKSMVIGGYPAIQQLSVQDQEQWFHDYIDTITQKDMRDLSVIEHSKDVPMLLSLCAARAGSLVNVSELSRDLRMNSTTLTRYLIMLETLFIVSMQQAWHTNLGKRLIKSPKAYLVDTGLLCWLSMMTVEKMMNNLNHGKGHVVENFVVNELLKQMTWNKDFFRMYHFRSAANQEVDIILERRDGKIIGIEVKSNQHVGIADIKGMLFLKESVPHLWHRGIVLYGGDVAIPLAEGITALPISALWAK